MPGCRYQNRGKENELMDDLKPCPFGDCHDRRVGIRKMGKTGYKVICSRCGSSGPYVRIADFPTKWMPRKRQREHGTGGRTMRLIDADRLIEGRVENDPLVIAAKCAPTVYDLDEVMKHPDKPEEKNSSKMPEAVVDFIRRRFMTRQ